jgi:transposase
VHEEIVHIMSNEVLLDRPLRRYHSNELKADVVRACAAPGASIAAIALSHGINAAIVHRWVRERGESVKQQEFLPVPISAASSDDGDDAGAVIEIELRRGSAVASIRWPLQGASACATLLRD